MQNVPKLSPPRKAGLVTMGLILGVAIHVLRYLILQIVNLKAFSPKLRFVDYMLGWSEWLSYIAFLTLALFLIHMNWRNLIRRGLIEDFKVLPENRPLYRRAISIPLFLVFTPAIMTFAVLRFVNGIIYVGPHNSLMMLFGLLPPSSGIIYTWSLSVHHMLSIILLAVISVIPVWRDIALPSIARNIIMLALAACIPIIIFASEQSYPNAPPAIIQIIFTLILAMTAFFESRTKEDIASDENMMSRIFR